MAPVVVLLLVVGLTALAPLALASPPDPLWIGGVFDAADGDDVVIAATTADAATDGATLAALKALWVVLGAILPAGSIVLVRSPLPVSRSRAPPIV